jgi:4-nitrophenyl phosphatase
VIGEQGLVDQLAEFGIESEGGPMEKNITMTPQEYEEYELDPELKAVICGFDMDVSYRKTSIATLYLQNGRKFIAWNDDMFDMVQGRPIPTTGVILKVLEYTTGETPYICGKPNPHIFDIITKQYNLKPEEKSKCIMIGDRLTTDMQFAKNTGIDWALVLTGWNKEEDINDPKENPNNIKPTYVLPRLGHFRKE